MTTPLRRCLIAACTLIVLAIALPAGAHAKGLVGLSICGGNGCRDRTAEVRPSATLTEGLISFDATVADPGPARFVRLKEHMGDGTQEFGVSTVVYFPGLGIARLDDGTFQRVTPAIRRSLRRLTRGVTPLPARALTPVEVAPYTPPREPVATGGADGPGAGVVGLLAAGAAAALATVSALAVRRRRRDAASGRPATG